MRFWSYTDTVLCSGSRSGQCVGGKRYRESITCRNYRPIDYGPCVIGYFHISNSLIVRGVVVVGAGVGGHDGGSGGAISINRYEEAIAVGDAVPRFRIRDVTTGPSDAVWGGHDGAGDGDIGINRYKEAIAVGYAPPEFRIRDITTGPVDTVW